MWWCLGIVLLAFGRTPAWAFGGERSLQQAQTPNFDTQPLSALPSDLVNDPTGRAHLLERLGNPAAYFGSYAYPWPEGQYAIDPSFDPAVERPIEGNDSPANGTFRVVGNSGMIAVHAIPFPNGDVLVYGRPAEPWGGGDPGGPGLSYLRVDNGTYTEIAAIYNTVTNTFKPFHIPEAPFCGAQTILPDGRGLLIGGELINLWYPYSQYGAVAVRIYDPETQTIETVNNFQRARWYPSVLTLADGRILIVGGGQQEIGGWGASGSPTSHAGEYETQTIEVACLQNTGPGDPYWDNPSFEVYDVETNTLSPALALTMLLEAYPINLYPFLWVLPQGSVLAVAGTIVQAMYIDENGAFRDEAVGILPKLPKPVGPNQYTPVAMLELAPPSYQTQIIVAGGPSDYCPNAKSPAGNDSFLMDVTPGADHSIVTEPMGLPRIGGDLINLPDGRLFLCNGAQIGIGGGGGPRYSNYAKPSQRAAIYDPSQPVGQRWKLVGNSQIPRLYHSTAFLTPNAEVLIAGSETTSERRVQIYTPDYLLGGKPRPNITDAPDTLTYGADFDIGFSGVDSITKVVLTRPTAVTHGNHFDARQVVLACADSTGTSVTCTAPPNSSIGVPGTYMLFILSDGVPSVAKYVTIPLNEPAAPPASAIARDGLADTSTRGTVTGAASAPVSAEPPQPTSFIGPEAGTSGHRNDSLDVASTINPEGIATSSSSTSSSSTAGK